MTRLILLCIFLNFLFVIFNDYKACYTFFSDMIHCKGKSYKLTMERESLKNYLIYGIQQTSGKMGLVMRKTVFGVFDLVRHKPGYTAKEDG